MKRIRKDIEISDLIYKSLRGETSKSEDELLEAWCLEPRNRKLFMELREADHLYEGWQICIMWIPRYLLRTWMIGSGKRNEYV